MYNLAGTLSDVDVSPGSNILMLGPAMSGKKRLALEVLAAGSNDGEGAIVVSTSDGADRIFNTYQDLIDADPHDIPFGIVDCVSRQQGKDDLDNDAHVKYTSSPVDMTGIGISLSEFLEEFHDERDIEHNRVCLDNISTLLMYSDLKTIFRFLHVFTGRVQNVDGLGLYLMDPSAHDAQTLNTLKGLFDGMIQTDGEESDAEFVYSGLEA